MGRKGPTSRQEALGKGICQWAERVPTVGRQLWAKATASGQKGHHQWAGRGQAHLAEDIPVKGDILISRANMGHAHLLPLNRRQGPI